MYHRRRGRYVRCRHVSNTGDRTYRNDVAEKDYSCCNNKTLCLWNHNVDTASSLVPMALFRLPAPAVSPDVCRRYLKTFFFLSLFCSGEKKVVFFNVRQYVERGQRFDFLKERDIKEES